MHFPHFSISFTKIQLDSQIYNQNLNIIPRVIIIEKFLIMFQIGQIYLASSLIIFS